MRGARGTSLGRAAITGAVRDPAGAPIAGARVCAQVDASEWIPQAVSREPACAASDPLGRYLLDGLVTGAYRVTAMARGYEPGVMIPGAAASIGGADMPPRLVLGAGERATGADLVLRPGGVEITGTVSDASGGPIAGARVRCMDPEPGSAVETDAGGHYALWIARGEVEISAAADGYLDATDRIDGPGALDLELVPESSITGVVIDAETGAPVEGMRVEAADDDDDTNDVSDAAGQFSLTRLPPGRYAVIATSATRYGRAPSSVRLGLTEHAGPLVVAVYPAFRVTGRVVAPGDGHAICDDAQVTLERDDQTLHGVRMPDGTLEIDGVFPGAYRVAASCTAHDQPADVAPIVVTTADVTGLEWTAGPPDGNWERASAIRQAMRNELATEPGEPGEIRGRVIDPTGAPVAGLYVLATGAGELRMRGLGVTRELHARSHADGSFTIAGVPPTAYDIMASRDAGDEGLHQPGSAELAIASIHVAPTQIASVELVVEPLNGMITGSVVGPDGAPVGDAYVTATREAADAASAAPDPDDAPATLDRHMSPVMTGPDGRFQLTRLAPGSYTVVADRTPGGRAQLAHVAVGGVAALRIRPTARIAGTVRQDGEAPDRFDVTVDCERGTGDGTRHEVFFHTGGAYAVDGLPAGPCTLEVSCGAALIKLPLELAEGEQRTGLDLALTSELTVTGRLVDLVSHAPVSGIHVHARPGRPTDDADGAISVTGADGRFVLRHAPQGAIDLVAMPEDFEHGRGYERLEVTRTIAGTGGTTVDLGDVPVVRDRVADGDPIGALGFTWAEHNDPWRVGAIDPAGPAAHSGLRPGDLVLTVDGAGITGDDAAHGSALLDAPPGTQLRLGLARGVTVGITLGPSQARGD